jgi:hypothetical protein
MFVGNLHQHRILKPVMTMFAVLDERAVFGFLVLFILLWILVIFRYEAVSKSFRTESVTKSTTTNFRWEATQRVVASKLTIPTNKIAIQLHLVAENCSICSSRSRRPVRKLLDTPSYVRCDRFPQNMNPESFHMYQWCKIVFNFTTL